MNPRDYSDQELLERGAAIFHGHVESMDSRGNYNGTGHNGEKFAGAIAARPYGFRSYAPKNTGLVLTYSEAGLLVLGQEGELPTGVSEPLSGETVLYNSQGAVVHLDENGDINITQKSGRAVTVGEAAGGQLKIATDGTIYIEQKSGQTVKIGSSATGQKAVVRHGDNTLSGDKFDTWALAVETGIPTGTAPPTSWGTGGIVGTAAATSTEVSAK